MSNIFAQNTFGAIHSNYCPTNGVTLNPANMGNTKTWLDINVIGAGSFINNNFVFIPDNTIMGATKLPFSEDSKSKDIYFDARKTVTRVFNHNFVAGPGATWNKGDHAAGLAINGRSYTGVQKLPDYMGRFIQNGLVGNVKQQQIDYNSQNLRIASLHFAEIKASYAYTFFKEGTDMLIGGISLKKIYSIAGGAANIYDIDINVQDDSTISLNHLQADLMYTPNPALNKKGGAGLDIGFVYQKMLTSCERYRPHSSDGSCRYIPYKYKVGFSIIDIGAVKFDPSEIAYAGYDISNYQWDNYANSQVDEDNALNLFSNEEADITAGVVNKTNKIKLPTFISAQFDYNLWASAFYVNGTIIQGVPHGKKAFGIRHANSLSISPRLETRLIDFSIPFSLYEYKQPQLGMSLRIGPITLGTDNIVNWIFNHDILGADLYFYAKIPFFYHPKCKKKMRAKGKGKQFRFGKSTMNCTY